MLAIVITTFNRAGLVLRSIKSALQFTSAFSDAEIVVVDDASTDQTGELLCAELASELRRGIIQYHRNAVNLGVTGSKNAGYAAARMKWVGFLDSDDTLLTASADACRATLEAYPSAPLIFFRCIDTGGQKVGHEFIDDQLLDLRTYVHHASYGEAFTVVNKMKVQVEPYVTELRGYEGLGCARIIARHGPAVLSAVYARRYEQCAGDRLSTFGECCPDTLLLPEVIA